MDEHSLRVLEYDKIIALVAERTACALGHERAMELLPTANAKLVAEWQQETTEARLLLGGHGQLPLGGIHDIRPSLVRAEVGQTLTPHELLDIQSTLQAATKLKQWLLRLAEKAPLLAGRAKNIEDFPQIVSDIDMAIGRSGDVLDSASPTLAAIRSHIRATGARINERLSQILSSQTYRPMLQDAIIVLRDDRRCIPVRSEHRRDIRGIVHDQSSSGATLFIEPMVVVELNNEMRQHEMKERQEIERILSRLSAGVGRLAERIHGMIAILAGLDLANAKARLADDLKAAEPVFSRNGVIRLRDARHPLIDPEVVVPIDLVLGERYKTLLITGPNTGGKTVSLKTVGLLTLMAQAGLHIPARTGSELAHFDQVFSDIGDEQSIAQSLSTFSAHVSNIVRILKSVGMRALVLLDELGAGTDPAEGAALAKAILSSLLQHNARVIATTHYGELKEFAYIEEGIENAAVEFDPETLRPTYRLLQGVPGSSNAFHVARRLGMPNPMVEQALFYLGHEEIDTGNVMRRLEESKRIADEERRRAERLSRELEDLKSRYEARLRDLELLRREARERAAEEARVLIRRNTEKMENIIGELRRIGKEGRKTQSARKRMKETAETLIGDIGHENEPLPVEEADIPTSLRKGEKVRVLSLGGSVGDVIADSSGAEVAVQIGNMRVTVPMTAVRAQKRTPEMAVAAPAPKKSGGGSIALAKASVVSPELSLIAQRVDAALPRLDRYLDDTYAAGLDSVRIIHGKGTGALRKAIWEFLKDDARVASFALAHPDDGGAGATVVQFKE